MKGFTLVEILITLVLFVLSVVALSGLFSTGMMTSVDAESVNVAANLAQARMEEIKNLDFDTEVVDEAKAAVSGFSGFEREVVVDTPQAGLKDVTVITYWTYKDDEMSLELQTYISKN